jgi:hypothetical protein
MCNPHLKNEITTKQKRKIEELKEERRIGQCNKKERRIDQCNKKERNRIQMK